jgi:mannose-6-phosphate isomerase-like protein (cupin superfamily)
MMRYRSFAPAIPETPMTRGCIMKRTFSVIAIPLALSASALKAQAVLMPDYPTAAGQGMASAQDLARAIAGMRKSIGDKAIAVQPVLRGDGASAALEYWARPLPPAVHRAEVEYVTVMQGSARLIYGGTLSAPREIRPGLLQGDEIVGGLSRELRPGDVVLIPSGMPHWFGPGPDGITMLGIKFSPPAAKKTP